jgi:DNA-binding transcriptional MerR regulator
MKKKWYRVREFADLAGVTVRALHYYDRIGLLSPGRTTDKGFRLYAQEDLLRLQQVLTLKFMGFSLEIRRLLRSRSYSVKKSLAIQIEAVENQAGRLRKAVKAMRETLALLEKSGRMDWEKIIHIIREVQMGEEIKKEWHEKFYTKDELKEFEEIGKGYSPEMMQAYQRRWTELIAEVEKNLDEDPAGEIGQSLAKRWSALLNEAYGGHPGLKQRIGEAYRSGAIPEDRVFFNAKVWEFIQKACEAGKVKM